MSNKQILYTCWLKIIFIKIIFNKASLSLAFQPARAMTNIVSARNTSFLSKQERCLVSMSRILPRRSLHIPTPNHSIRKNGKSFKFSTMTMSSHSSLTSIEEQIPSTTETGRIIMIQEKQWKEEARSHRDRIYSLLKPGLTPMNHAINSGCRRGGKRRLMKEDDDIESFTALDSDHPVFNFMIEYYGLKGAKGTKKLGRWSPDPSLLLTPASSQQNREIDSTNSDLWQTIMSISEGRGGIFLENATEDDIGGILHLRGCLPIPLSSCSSEDKTMDGARKELQGVLYNPAVFYQRQFTPTIESTHTINNTDQNQVMLKTIAPFVWYSSILENTLASDPILHCYGLHEWAMQYRPSNAPPPPSAKYQSHLPLRVSQQVINSTVERRGVHCSHIDALRFFAPAAIPLNKEHGDAYPLDRVNQLQLEQKGCVHAHMDLLKIALKLQPFIDSSLVGDVLTIALQARKMDIEASPYDATAYGLGIIAIEKDAGRRLYKQRQIELMEGAESVRARLLRSYRDFMTLAFDEELIQSSMSSVQNKQLP